MVPVMSLPKSNKQRANNHITLMCFIAVSSQVNDTILLELL